MDIFPEMLQEVEIRVKENSILNVETILTEENDLKLEDSKITIAFISNVHCMRQKIKSKFGSPTEHRLDKIDSLKMLDTLGFSNISTIDIGENFYGLTAQK